MTDRQIAFQTMRTLGCIGTHLFSKNHMLPPKTKKGLAELKIQNESFMYVAKILTGNDDLTMDDLIDIGVNGKDFREYMKPYTNDVRYKEFMEG